MTDLDELVEFGDFCDFCDAAAWPLSEFEDDTAARPDPIDRDLWEQCQRIARDQGGVIDGITVKFVDFAPLKIRYRMDAVEGDNWLHSDFVPDHEVWIDTGNAAKNWPYVLMHEMHEIRLMQAGLSYDAAHKRANAVERVLRIEGGLTEPVEIYERRVIQRLGLFGKLLNQGFQVLGRRLFGLFERQRQSVLAKIRMAFVGRQGTATQLLPATDTLFDLESAAVDTRATAYHVLDTLLVNGSLIELEGAAGARIRKLAKLNYDTERLRLHLPTKVKVGLDETLAQAMSMPYWAAEAEQTRNKIQQAVAESVRNGDSLDDTSARILAALPRGESRVRAERIARTEATRGLNGGLQLSRDYLARLGIVVAKRWVAVDPKQVTTHPTRKDHALAHGQTVLPDEFFLVGGEPCRFPGDPNLSAKQSVNCRCLAVSIRK